MGRKSNYTHGRTRDHCYFCGAFGGIEEHHVIPQRFDGPDKPENIVGLCETCHNKLERLYDKSFYEYFGIEDEQGKRRFHTRCPMPECDELVAVAWRGGTGSTIYSCGHHDVDRSRLYGDTFEVIETSEAVDDLSERAPDADNNTATDAANRLEEVWEGRSP